MQCAPGGERASTHQSWLFIWNGHAPRKFAVLSIYRDPVLHTVDLHSSSYNLCREEWVAFQSVLLTKGRKRESNVSGDTSPEGSRENTDTTLGKCPEDQLEVNVEEAGFQVLAQVTWGQA